MIAISSRCHLKDEEIKIKFIHASGPGGQNVNKVATAAQLRFSIARCEALSPEEKQRLTLLAGSKATVGGDLVITARRYRTQEGNRQDAVERLVQLIRKALEKPKPRIKRKPSLTAKRRRVDDKRVQGERKRLRKPVL